MTNKTKYILVGAVALVIALLAFVQVTNKDLLQGRLTTVPAEEILLPDLTVQISVVETAENNNVTAKITLENIGEGPVSGETPYNYSLYVNDELVFTNTDSYVEMAPGGKFTFSYPVERAIYNYEDSGYLKIVLDKDDMIKELDESNNSAEVEYSL